jgi:hypothetical protein
VQFKDIENSKFVAVALDGEVKESKNMGLIAARGNDICMNRYALHTYVHTVSSGKTRCVFSGPADRPRLYGIVWNRSCGFVAIRMDTTANLLD